MEKGRQGERKAMLDRLDAALPGFRTCSEGAGFSPELTTTEEDPGSFK